MRPIYAAWLQREDFQRLTRTDPIVAAHVAADVPVIDLVLALAQAKQRILDDYVTYRQNIAQPMLIVRGYAGEV